MGDRDIHNLISDLQESMEKKSGTRTPRAEKKYHRHEEYVAYGLKAADFYALLDSYRSRILEFSLNERLSLSRELLATRLGELGHAGIRVLCFSIEELTPRHFPVLDRLMEDFRSWSQVDHFCACVLQPLLRKFRKETLAQLEVWNLSPQRFKRRASVVTFVRKIAETGEFTRDVLRLCENLIWDREDIVLKGAGWALKDNMRSAPDQVIPFVKELRSRGVSSTLTLYAIRDLRGKMREDVLAVKKKEDRE